MESITKGLVETTQDFKNKIHADICPIVIGILGNGRVSSGVLYVLDRLPHVRMKIQDVAKLIENSTKEQLYEQFNSKIIVTILDMDDLYLNKNTHTFDFKEFSSDPSKY